MSHSMIGLINRKKAGKPMGAEEFSWLCQSYVDEEIPDYQMAAWLMAVRLNGLGDDEILHLTEGMVATGASLEWDPNRPVVDKHSTGGVGDKTSIALVPLVAAAGLWFPKMSGRGLGHTGGTLDKLESIPGFRVDLTLEEMRAQVEAIGCAIVGQSSELVPADGLIYALRDVTGTVDSIPLIASSIMSKKLALGAHTIVLDVKWGEGAIMKKRVEAELLARTMVDIGRGAERSIRAVLSPMGQPLGKAVGNALEVREAIETLHGGGPDDLRDLIIQLGAQVMVASGATPSLEDAMRGLRRLIDSGVAVQKLGHLIEAQGGDPAVAERPELLPRAKTRREVVAKEEGWVRNIDALGVAQVALSLGAGRKTKTDPVDPTAGVVLRVQAGDRISKGDVVGEIHCDSAAAAEGAERALSLSIDLSDDPVNAPAADTEIILSDR